MGIIYWICCLIRKADFTPSFKVGNFNFLESAAFIVSACCCISMGCRLKDRKVGEVGLWRGEGWRFNGFNVIYEGLDST